MQNLIQINRLICGDENEATIMFSESKEYDSLQAHFLGKQNDVLADVRKISPNVEMQQTLSIRVSPSSFENDSSSPKDTILEIASNLIIGTTLRVRIQIWMKSSDIR